ncbi:hypothetical protein [Enteractinococcus helveticum]|nr:hypothetical protein [Enteractinococcus helveticum]
MASRPSTGLPPARWRIFFLLPAGLAMLAALNAGLLLLNLPAPIAAWADLHGVLMVVGFLGTLIAMERAVALRHPLGYLAPALLGAGALGLLTPLPTTLGQLLFIEGALALCIVYLVLWRRSRDVLVLVQLLGGLHLLIATLAWLVAPVSALVPWFIGFLVLTISAERVELARFQMPPHGTTVLVATTTALTVTLTAGFFWPDLAVRLTGTLLVILVLWLVQHDVARAGMHGTGLRRYSSVALLTGYGWLLVAAVCWLIYGHQISGFAYDAIVHAVMLGFALSMVMSHAPIILPAVLRRPLPYRPILWIPLALLHIGLILRVLTGDLLQLTVLWQIGGVITVAALLVFVLTAATSSLLGEPPTPATRSSVTNTPDPAERTP